MRFNKHDHFYCYVSATVEIDARGQTRFKLQLFRILLFHLSINQFPSIFINFHPF